MQCRCGSNHVPFKAYFHSSWWHDNYGFEFGRECYEDPEYRGTMRWKMDRLLYDRFGDIGFGHPDPPRIPIVDGYGLATIPMILGCDKKFFTTEAPAVISPCLSSASEAWSLKVPDHLEGSPPISALLEQADYLRAKYGHVAYAIYWLGPLNLALLVRGTEQLFVDFYEDPQLAHHVLRVATETIYETIRLLESRLELPPLDVSYNIRSYEERPENMCYQVSNCSVGMISNESYEEFVLPYDNYLAERLGSFAIHDCGLVKAVAPGYAKVKNVRRIEAGWGSDLRQMRSYFPNVWLAARLDSANMLTASPEEIEHDVKQLVPAGKPLSHLAIEVMGLDSDTPDESVRWMHDMVAKHGILDEGISETSEPYWVRALPP